MRAVLLGKHEPNTPEWDAIRSKGIGGSEIAAIVGLSPWQSKFSLWHQKRGTIGKQDVNAGMRWGTLLEPVICHVWADLHPEFVALSAGTYRHEERTWQLANCDRLLIDAKEFWQNEDVPSSFLEVKTAHQYDAHEWGTGPEDVPPYYRCQVLWYMDVLELPEAHMAVLIGGSDYREYVIRYNVDEAEWLREQGRLFWESVKADEPPPLDGSEATYEAVRRLHPEINGEDADLDPALYARYVDSKALVEESAKAHRQAKSEVLDAMGQAKRALVDETPVLRRQPARGGSVALYPINQPKTEREAS